MFDRPYAVAILHANNIRDAEFDRKHGKMTLADTLGGPGDVPEYALLVLMPLLITVALVLVGRQFWPLLVALLGLPFALRVTSLLRRGVVRLSPTITAW